MIADAERAVSDVRQLSGVIWPSTGRGVCRWVRDNHQPDVAVGIGERLFLGLRGGVKLVCVRLRQIDVALPGEQVDVADADVRQRLHRVAAALEHQVRAVAPSHMR